MHPVAGNDRRAGAADGNAVLHNFLINRRVAEGDLVTGRNVLSRRDRLPVDSNPLAGRYRTERDGHGIAVGDANGVWALRGADRATLERRDVRHRTAEATRSRGAIASGDACTGASRR